MNTFSCFSIHQSNNWLSLISQINLDTAIFLEKSELPTIQEKIFTFFDHVPPKRPTFSLFSDHSISIGNTYNLYATTEKKEPTEEEKRQQSRKKIMITAGAIFTFATAYSTYLYSRFNKIHESFKTFDGIKTCINTWNSFSKGSIEADIYTLINTQLELDARRKGVYQEEFFAIIGVAASALTLFIGAALSAEVAVGFGLAGVAIGSLAFVVSLMRNYITIEPKNLDDANKIFNLSSALIKTLQTNPSDQLGGQRLAEVVAPPVLNT